MSVGKLEKRRAVYDPVKVRKDFPIFTREEGAPPFVYLDTAAMAQKPKIMIDTLADFYGKECSTVHRSVYSQAISISEKYAEVRTDLAVYLGAEREEEIIFTRGTTEALNLVAMTYGRANIKPGDEILVTEMEHHSNLVPWQILAKEKGATLQYVGVLDDGRLDLEDYKKKLSCRTKIVATVHISNVLGTVNPIKEMATFAHEVGAVIVVDGAQSVVHTPIDVVDLDVDFFAMSGSKLYGPTGIGALYGKYDLLANMPPYHGGGDMIDQVTKQHVSYRHPPLKFEAGTPMIAAVLGLGASIRYLKELSAKAWKEHEEKLLQLATKRLKEEIPGITIYGNAPNKAPIISFSIKGVHPLDMATFLDFKGIMLRTGHLCAQPLLARFNVSSLARISFGIYSLPGDVDHLIAGLKETVSLLCK